jgi:hypothetical protein
MNEPIREQSHYEISSRKEEWQLKFGNSNAYFKFAIGLSSMASSTSKPSELICPTPLPWISNAWRKKGREKRRQKGRGLA